MKGRKAVAIEGIDQYNFAKLASSKGTPRERRRYLAFAHIQDGKCFSEAARMVKVKERTIMNWVRKFRECGLEGLKEKPGRGAKPYISQKEYENFRESVEKLQKNRSGGRIRGKDIGDLIQKMTGKRPCKSTVYDTLKRAGLVWITGRSQHPKTDKETQEAFKKTSGTRFCKSYQKK